MTAAVPNPTPNVRPRSRTRPLIKKVSLILLGLVLGLGLSRLINFPTGTNSDLTAAQSQTAQSLKSLHDKLDQIDTLNQTVQSLSQEVRSLNQTISLQNDMASIKSANPNPAVLATTSADLYPADYATPAGIGGL